MRLLRIEDENTFVFAEFFDLTTTPPYAILSHTWEAEEVTYHDMLNKEIAMSKAGYQKILGFCSAAILEGLKYVWVDTCCIDKSSSAELSEAINSMYRWYRQAAKCFVYLADISKAAVKQLSKSRWFTRGWTLQELVAPSNLSFYDHFWQPMFSKSDVASLLAEITGIDEAILTGEYAIQTRSIAQRMSWASKRVTTRQEDIAYCLMGIFDVNMSLLYGEGDKAFIRLQEEIMKDSDDTTLFAWEPCSSWDRKDIVHYYTYPMSALLAPSPACFARSGNMQPLRSVNTAVSKASDPEARVTFSMTNQGLRLDIPMSPLDPLEYRDSLESWLAHLDCVDGYHHGAFTSWRDEPRKLGIRVWLVGPRHEQQYARCARDSKLIVVPTSAKPERRTIYVRKRIVVPPAEQMTRRHGIFIRQQPHPTHGYKLVRVQPDRLWDREMDIIRSPVTTAILFFHNTGVGTLIVMVHIGRNQLFGRTKVVGQTTLPRCACKLLTTYAGQTINLEIVENSLKELESRLTTKTFIEIAPADKTAIVEVSRIKLLGHEMFALDVNIEPNNEVLFELPSIGGNVSPCSMPVGKDFELESGDISPV